MVVGGSGNLYAKLIKKMAPKIPIEVVGETPAEGRFANVRGFQLVAERQLHDALLRQ